MICRGGPLTPLWINNIGSGIVPEVLLGLVVGLFRSSSLNRLSKKPREDTHSKLSAVGIQLWPLGGLHGSEESPFGALLFDETVCCDVPPKGR